ncbi:AEC family transporter [Alkalicoccobacillus plakortidis]|uniref:AEC family transporter n=1 Tax=Alkalicoccobacillus plakortidis TaxID=444060 RepID=A0ABT0XG47_9BACI|nr:AEC family transporter [Alkalicoccobacillus plakortidis]MCM2674881.1 AEC family transporter [Alkalicoccobacillus plakortidis]
MAIFIQVVLPVILIFVVGFLLQKIAKIDIRPISTMAIYVMTPCLVFKTFYETELNSQYTYMVIFSFLLMFILIFLCKVYTKIRKIDLSTENALILSTAFMNTGNYGTPIILFAYGEAGFEFAISAMVLQSILMNFFGVYYAVKGKAGIRIAMKSVAKMPASYAAVLALLLNVFNLRVPENLFGTIDLISDAAIPMVMVILGMQLAMIKWGHFDWANITFSVVLRMFISPLIAWLLVMVMPIDPLLGKVLIVSAAMPSAATIVMYAVQFQAQPKLVSSVTLITTIISIPTITLLIILLG